MSTTDIARAITGALQPLMGAAATGQLFVHSTGATGTVSAGAVAVPILGGALFEEGAVFVKKNSATADGSWPVVLAGTLINVEALQGGLVANQVGGTIYRWDPPLTGIEATSASNGAGLTGGALTGSLRQVRSYKELARADAQTFFRAQLAEFPGVALAWESTAPLDGALAAAPAPRTARVGRGRMLFRDTWILWVVTSRLDSDTARTQEGDILRDAILETLLDTRCARNVLQLSQTPGVTILDARVASVTPTSYVDMIRFGTTRTLEHTDAAVYNDWLKTRIRQQTATQGVNPAIDIPDYTIPMT